MGDQEKKGNGMSELVKSISYDQSEIIRSILRLHVPNGRIDCDSTYSTGGFYNGTGIEPPELKYDLYPQAEGVQKADARTLPLADESISCMMFDPPFLATKGESLKAGVGNIINRRFGVYPDEQSLHRFYADAIKEAHRVLKAEGILIFKCQDKVSSGKQYMSHVFVMNEAVKAGFYPADIFILLAKNRLIADWQIRNQKHARKYHCYFWVFRKSDLQITYADDQEK